MHVLGISCHSHDSAAVLLRDGQLIAAVQEERFSRIRHDAAFPAQAIGYCLAKAGIRAADVDYAVFYEKPFLKAARLATSVLAEFPKTFRLFRDGMHHLKERLWVKEDIRRHVGIDSHRILFVEHHLSHAASALYTSPFEQAAILTIDGVGEWSTATMGRGSADWGQGASNSIALTHELRFPHSLGLLYSVFAAFLGFEVNEGESVMGMAAFGQPKYVDKIKKILELREDGSLWLDPAYVSFPYHTKRAFTKRLEELFGPPRDPKARFVTAKTPLYDDLNPPTKLERGLNQYYADVAASLQQVTEDVMIAMARHLHRSTGLTKLCLAGDVALNGVANYKVLRATPFDEIYVQPAAGDAGGALGAALYAYHVLLAKPRAFVMDHAYWGKTYPDSLIVDTLREKKVDFEAIDNDDKVLDRVVDSLQAGEVIGWYHGAFEWGPRALGARSIIANPTRRDMQFREPFRPLGPSVLADKVSHFFDLGEAAKHYPARFMLYASQVTSDRIPAVAQVDGSSHPQAVHRDVSPRYHRLIEKFGEASGVPLVMQTPFNLKGEPIVSAPIDALNTFQRSGMDMLVLENVIVRKTK
jgi:carbamoyltransferase